MFKIGDFSKLARVSVRMLRHYDEEGLFHPHHVDEMSGYRYYRASQLDEITRIRSYRDMGFQIAEIHELFLASSDVERRALLLRKKEETSERLSETKERLAMIEAALEAAGKEHKRMETKVIMKRIEGFQALALRDRIPAYDAEGMLWQRLGAFIEKNGTAVGTKSYATYHDDGYVEGPVDVEVLIEVVGDCEAETPFTLRWSEPIERCATLAVHGDFSHIAPAFSALGRWIEDRGLEIAGPARELPLRGPWNESDPEKYLNEIQIPVR